MGITYISELVPVYRIGSLIWRYHQRKSRKVPYAKVSNTFSWMICYIRCYQSSLWRGEEKGRISDEYEIKKKLFALQPNLQLTCIASRYPLGFLWARPSYDCWWRPQLCPNRHRSLSGDNCPIYFCSYDFLT